MSNSAIKRVYRSLPNVNCKGLCAESCGPILYSEAEAKRMRERGVTPPTWDDTATCTALKNNRCSIYENRPFICRLFGATKALRCKHGCAPDKWVTQEEENRMMAELGPLVAEHVELLHSLNSKSHLLY